MADRTTPIANTLLNADATPNAGLPVAVTLLVPGNVAAQDASLQVIGTTPLAFVTNAAGTWTGAVIPPGDLTPAGCRYQVTEGARVTISPSFAYTSSTIVVATWYASPPSSGLILMYLTELEANALANPGATFSAAISQDAVWTGGAGIGQVIGAGAPPVQLQTNSSGIWQAYFPPSSQLNPATTFYTLVLDSGISLAFTVPVAYTGDQGAWLVGTTYAINAVVQVAGVPYKSLQNANTGNAPASSPTFWALYVGESITGRLTAPIAAGQIALAAAGIGHSANVPALIDDLVQAPVTSDDDLKNLNDRTGFAIRTISVATTLSATTDDYVLGDATGGALAITLPGAATRARPYYIVRKDSTANALTVVTTSAQTINGAATLTIAPNTAYVLRSDGANWRIAASNTGGLSNPMTTPGDLIVGGTAGAPGRTAVGAAAQVLTVVGGVPAWANSASGFANPMTTKGDLIASASGGTATRFPAGNDGTTLVADSAQALGVRWISGRLVAVTAAYTTTATDTLLKADCTVASFTITLLGAASAGQPVTIKRVDGSANTVTIATTGGQSIDGQATLALTGQYVAVTLVSDGANWFVI